MWNSPRCWRRSSPIRYQNSKTGASSLYCFIRNDCLKLWSNALSLPCRCTSLSPPSPPLPPLPQAWLCPTFLQDFWFDDIVFPGPPSADRRGGATPHQAATINTSFGAQHLYWPSVELSRLCISHDCCLWTIPPPPPPSTNPVLRFVLRFLVAAACLVLSPASGVFLPLSLNPPSTWHLIRTTYWSSPQVQASCFSVHQPCSVSACPSQLRCAENVVGVHLFPQAMKGINKNTERSETHCNTRTRGDSSYWTVFSCESDSKQIYIPEQLMKKQRKEHPIILGISEKHITVFKSHIYTHTQAYVVQADTQLNVYTRCIWEGKTSAFQLLKLLIAILV